jgi:hypothetical protein
MRTILSIAVLAFGASHALHAQSSAPATPAPHAAPPTFVEPDTMSVVRGTVTDRAGHPLDSIEVYVMTSGQRTRTDAAGHYVIVNLLNGPTRLRARRVGWQPADTTFVLARHTTTIVNFVLAGRVSALDTIRVRTSQDDCAPRNFYGFACRRRAGVGVFRDSAELAALKPDYDADLFDGIPGLRRDGHGVVAVTHWRCLVRLINGHPPTPYDRESAKMLGYVDGVKAIEFYADAHDAPKWYKVFTWPAGSPTPCSLIVYWTR